MGSTTSLKFGNLPLVEATVRASFSETIPLQFSKILPLHQQLQKEFPTISEPKQLEVAPGITQRVELRHGNITGAVLENQQRGLSATLQEQVLVVRWRKQPTLEPADYPGYQKLRTTIWDVRDVVKEVFALTSLQIAVVNMSYVNFIKVASPATVLTDYFSNMVLVRATEASIDHLHKLEISWRGNDLDLRFGLEHATAEHAEQKQEGFLLTTVAGVQVDSSTGNPEEACLDAVHDRLQSFFKDLISERAKSEWKFSEE
jgi:uncharacterized protein (TIGR04255 family)